MPTQPRFVAIPCSCASLPANSRSIKLPEAKEQFEVAVVLEPGRLSGRTPAGPKLAQLEERVKGLELLLPRDRAYLSRAELAEYNAPAPGDVELVEKFAAESDLQVIEKSPLRHDVVLKGTAEGLNGAFRVELREYEQEGVSFRAYSGPVQLPAYLKDVVVAVLGLDSVPLAQRAQVDQESEASQARGGLEEERPAESGLRPEAVKKSLHSRSRALASKADVSSPGRTRRKLTLSPEEVEHLYGFPRPPLTAPPTRGNSSRIALLQFGGGYHPQDLEDYFRKLNLPGLSRIRDVPVSVSSRTGANAPLPFDALKRFAEAWRDRTKPLKELIDAVGADRMFDAMATLEVTMDIQIVGALAPDAAIDVYFVPRDSGVEGWRRALFAALGEPVGANDRSHAGSVDLPSAISISWGASEKAVGERGMRIVNQALEAAKNLGVSVCCSSGDFGWRNSPPVPNPSGTGPQARSASMANVNFPASSPFALACGGTEVLISSHAPDAVAFGDQFLVQDEVWNEQNFGHTNASGGGVSGFFPIPAYQLRYETDVPSHAELRGQGKYAWMSTEIKWPEFNTFRGRGVPDVAAMADLATGFGIRIGGIWSVGGGTSVAAPIWAALVTTLGQSLNARVGWLNPLIYDPRLDHIFDDILEGNNDLQEEVDEQGRPIHYFDCQVGWDACTGLGAPYGGELLAELMGGEGTQAEAPPQ